MNAYFNSGWNFHYFSQNREVVENPFPKSILKCIRFKLNPLIRKLFDHLPPKESLLLFVLILSIFFPIRALM